jgi:hypothetical protein
VKNTSTGLEWKVGPDEETNWYGARSWVRSLGGDWRMPMMDELEGLYKKGMGSHNLTSLLEATSSKVLWVWSGEENSSTTFLGFFFDDGYSSSSRHGSRSWAKNRDSNNRRAFAVRSTNQRRDGQYVAYTNGIVKNTSTGLEWKVGPNEETGWNKARSWVQSLGGDWRMPMMDELKGLYNKRKGNRNMTPLLKTTGWNVWSGETNDSGLVWSFFFGEGAGSWNHPKIAIHARAFAVRSKSDK